MYKILLIDDDKDLCNLLERELKNENFEVIVCHDGQTGLDTFKKQNYQLIILDIMLPAMNGYDVLTEIRKLNNVPVLMLTAKDSEIDKVSGLRLGADDYLTKPFLMAEFVARVQSLIRRFTVFNNHTEENITLKFKGLQIDVTLRTVLLNDNQIYLTAREFDLLYFLASNQGRVFTKEQIYTHVWNNEYSYDDRNIMSFVSKLRKKIKNEKLDIDYIQTIHGIGYRFCLGV
ncbi:TPA: response regulator transcription factor [Clostridioides difficile]|uniref:Stage 0 sporulation protein A homolog n=4 Tax=Bacillota TaxID=1239 RepID=Q18DA9_CLOD6|nr:MULTISPECIES: response regulator transcription factor [Bacillota]MDU6396593.1 response regulator transcription factor [Bacteroides sp.]AJP10062.1 two-component response regulator [Clostridioides difficile 630]ARE61270.1 two-component response regulator [Clostridioides difficile]AXB63283.1 two-component system response regulator [Clostridioides difficile]EGT3677279.1 response regulator transcription factor [Clostridioides difficile]